MKQELTAKEEITLKKLEAVIGKGLPAFYEVGTALLRIRDKELYRGQYKTFEQYCHDRWKMSRPRAYQLIGYAKVQEDLSTMVDKPTSERQGRSLVGLTPKQRKKAWKKAVKTAPKGRVTGKHVEKIVKEMTENTEDGTGRKLEKYVDVKERTEPLEKEFDYSEDMAEEIRDYVFGLLEDYGQRIASIGLRTIIKVHRS